MVVVLGLHSVRGWLGHGYWDHLNLQSRHTSIMGGDRNLTCYAMRVSTMCCSMYSQTHSLALTLWYVILCISLIYWNYSQCAIRGFRCKFYINSLSDTVPPLNLIPPQLWQILSLQSQKMWHAMLFSLIEFILCRATFYCDYFTKARNKINIFLPFLLSKLAQAQSARMKSIWKHKLSIILSGVKNVFPFLISFFY